jgi:hypothetical protein
VIYDFLRKLNADQGKLEVLATATNQNLPLCTRFGRCRSLLIRQTHHSRSITQLGSVILLCAKSPKLLLLQPDARAHASFSPVAIVVGPAMCHVFYMTQLDYKRWDGDRNITRPMLSLRDRSNLPMVSNGFDT